MAGLVSQGACRDVYERNLSLAAGAAASAGISILIEPINTFDMPGYLLNRTEEASDIISAVGKDNLGLQFDLYHRHRMQGGVVGAIARYARITRHFQIAGPPDRGEPHPSDFDVAEIFSAIDAVGYDGWMGCEYKPRAGTEEGLAWRNLLPATA